MDLNMIEPDAGLQLWAGALADRTRRAEALQRDPQFRKAALLAERDPAQEAMAAAKRWPVLPTSAWYVDGVPRVVAYADGRVARSQDGVTWRDMRPLAGHEMVAGLPPAFGSAVIGVDYGSPDGDVVVWGHREGGQLIIDKVKQRHAR